MPYYIDYGKQRSFVLERFFVEGKNMEIRKIFRLLLPRYI